MPSEIPRFLSVERVLALHQEGIRSFGGSHGLRDLGLLQSAVQMPESGLGERYFHRDLYEMAAAYLFHIVKNHPFVDGNKRTGTLAALVFLEGNGIELAAGNDPLADMVLSVAEGKLDKAGVAAFFRKHSRKAR